MVFRACKGSGLDAVEEAVLRKLCAEEMDAGDIRVKSGTGEVAGGRWRTVKDVGEKPMG